MHRSAMSAAACVCVAGVAIAAPGPATADGAQTRAAERRASVALSGSQSTAPDWVAPETNDLVSEDGEILLTGAEERDFAAQEYATDEGITVADARERLIQQEKMDDALEAYHVQYPDTFAGGIVQDQPTFEILFRFVNSVPSNADDIAADAGVLAAAFDGTATKSYKQMEDEANDASTAIEEGYSGENFVVGFDLATNEIEATVEEPEASGRWAPTQLRGWRRAVRADLAAATTGDTDIDFTTQEMAVQPEAQPSIGGGQARFNDQDECTFGFPVAVNNYGLMTANHCNNALRYRKDNGTNWLTDWKNGYVGRYGEMQWNDPEAGHQVSGSFFSHAQKVNKVTGIKTRWSQGQRICNFGQTTLYKCDRVFRVSGDATNRNGVRVGRLVFMNHHRTDFGDSGGPWFRGGTAAGVHFGAARYSAGTPVRSIYSKFEMLDNMYPGMKYVCYCD